MEYRLGEVINYNGVKLQVVEFDHDCSTCYFCDNGCGDVECTQVCGDVKFKPVEQCNVNPKIGDVIGYGAINLKVTEWTEDNGCHDCYFQGGYACPGWCNEETKFILIEQCNRKDMKKEAEEYKALPMEEKTENKVSGDVCKAGESYVCVNSLTDADDVTRYTKGKMYKCHADGCLVDDTGMESVWNGCEGFGETFVSLKDVQSAECGALVSAPKERVNHPDYYNRHPSGVECITIIRHYNFNVGNAIKYLWRQGLKTEEGMTDKDKQIEDLKKAIFYISDEIDRLQKY